MALGNENKAGGRMEARVCWVGGTVRKHENMLETRVFWGSCRRQECLREPGRPERVCRKRMRLGELGAGERNRRGFELCVISLKTGRQKGSTDCYRVCAASEGSSIIATMK